MRNTPYYYINPAHFPLHLALISQNAFLQPWISDLGAFICCFMYLMWAEREINWEKLNLQLTQWVMLLKLNVSSSYRAHRLFSVQPLVEDAKWCISKGVCARLLPMIVLLSLTLCRLHLSSSGFRSRLKPPLSRWLVDKDVTHRSLKLWQTIRKKVCLWNKTALKLLEMKSSLPTAPGSEVWRYHGKIPPVKIASHRFSLQLIHQHSSHVLCCILALFIRSLRHAQRRTSTMFWFDEIIRVSEEKMRFIGWFRRPIEPHDFSWILWVKPPALNSVCWPPQPLCHFSKLSSTSPSSFCKLCCV